MTRPVTLALPDPLWGRLAARADRDGVKVEQVIAEALDNAALAPLEKPKKRQAKPRLTPDGDRQVIELVELGYSLPEIAIRMRVGRDSVIASMQRVHARATHDLAVLAERRNNRRTAR